MKIIKDVLLKNRETRGKLFIFIGGVVLSLSLLFSEGYEAPVGLFGSLPVMYLNIADAKYETTTIQITPKDDSWLSPTSESTTNLVRDEVKIPIRYLLFVGLFFVGVGIYTFLFDKKVKDSA